MIPLTVLSSAGAAFTNTRSANGLMFIFFSFKIYNLRCILMIIICVHHLAKFMPKEFIDRFDRNKGFNSEKITDG
jgi:hypothetical protein